MSTRGARLRSRQNGSDTRREPAPRNLDNRVGGDRYETREPLRTDEVSGARTRRPRGEGTQRYIHMHKR